MVATEHTRMDVALFSVYNQSSRSRGYCCLVTTAATSSRKTGLRPRAGSSGTASTILAGPPGALGFTGELTADLLET
jgi:hypothetical protein